MVKSSKGKSPSVSPVKLMTEMGKAVVKALESNEGDVLCFLPGNADLRRCEPVALC